MRGISREVLARDAAWSLADGACKDLTIEWARWENTYAAALTQAGRPAALAAPAAVCSACPITAECADLAALGLHRHPRRRGLPQRPTRPRAFPGAARTQDGMSAWQLYPHHVWPPDAGHPRVLLVMGLPERRALGATSVQDPADAAALLARLVDAHGCPATLRSIWDPLFEDLNTAAREAVHQASCAKPVAQLEPDDFIWALDTSNAATQAIGASNPSTIDDAATALKTWMHTTDQTSAPRVTARRSGSLTVDAHPCEGPGSDPQDLLPDDRAWGSRTSPSGVP